MNADYRGFLESKAVNVAPRGMDDTPVLASHLFKFQADAVKFGLRAGSWGLFFDTGLGKTACELEWCRHAAEASNGLALILTPLAVARQIEAEGLRWGYDARVIRDQSEARAGINICNYDRLHLLDAETFGAVALDEASVLKSFTGKTTRSLIATFSEHRWRMAATATPAPNDHVEIAQYAEFLGIMGRDEMLVRWFINDASDTGTWRLKGHAANEFWSWMASWSRMAEHPRDMGDDQPGFDLPPLKIRRHRAATEARVDGALFGDVAVSATEMHNVKRQTATARAEMAVRLAATDSEPWVIWCDTDYEADALCAAAADCLDSWSEVRGSHPIEKKERALDDFSSRKSRVLITKPSVAGFGLNWQHCANVAFVGRSFSYESWYQAVRRCWRFGQSRPVTVHVIVADGEDSIGRVLDRKADDHNAMKAAMVSAMRRIVGESAALKVPYQPTHNARLPAWLKGAA
jgi:hypothetical protein